MKKKNQYENEPLASDYCPSDYEFRTPADGLYDSRWAVRIRRDTVTYFTYEQIAKCRTQVVSGHKYRINSIFANTAARSLDDNIKHLIGNEIDNVS